MSKICDVYGVIHLAAYDFVARSSPLEHYAARFRALTECMEYLGDAPYDADDAAERSKYLVSNDTLTTCLVCIGNLEGPYGQGP